MIFSRDQMYFSLLKIAPPKVARLNNISLHELYKICFILSVPVPQASYWRDKTQGRTVPRIPLPPTNGPISYPVDIQSDSESMRLWELQCSSVLSCDEIKLITGATSKKKQLMMLIEMKILFILDVAGSPLVPRASIENTASVAVRVIRMLEQVKLD